MASKDFYVKIDKKSDIEVRVGIDTNAGEQSLNIQFYPNDTEEYIQKQVMNLIQKRLQDVVGMETSYSKDKENELIELVGYPDASCKPHDILFMARVAYEALKDVRKFTKAGEYLPDALDKAYDNITPPEIKPKDKIAPKKPEDIVLEKEMKIFLTRVVKEGDATRHWVPVDGSAQQEPLVTATAENVTAEFVDALKDYLESCQPYYNDGMKGPEVTVSHDGGNHFTVQVTMEETLQRQLMKGIFHEERKR